MNQENYEVLNVVKEIINPLQAHFPIIAVHIHNESDRRRVTVYIGISRRLGHPDGYGRSFKYEGRRYIFILLHGSSWRSRVRAAKQQKASILCRIRARAHSCVEFCVRR